MVRKGREGKLRRIVKVPVSLGSTEGEVGTDKTDGHEKWTLTGLGSSKPLDGLCRNSSVGIVLITGIGSFKSGTSRKRANLVELLVGEVGFFSGELSPFRTGGV